jgi:hypothetical protein
MDKRAETKLIASSLALLFSVGCAGEDTLNTEGDSRPMTKAEMAQHQADLAFGLITEVVVAHGHTVKFMEPSPGAFAISETFDLDNRIPLNLGQPVDLIWEEIGGGRQMPDALARLAEAQHYKLEAAALADSSEDALADASDTLPAGPEPERSIDDKHITSSGLHFEQDQLGCRTLGSSIKWRWCWENRTGGWEEAIKSGEAIATAVSVYAGFGLTLCNRMGFDNHCADVRGGQGTYFIGNVGTNFFGVHVDQDLGSKLTLVVMPGTNWHWGGSISGNYANAFTFGGYRLDL